MTPTSPTPTDARAVLERLQHLARCAEDSPSSALRSQYLDQLAEETLAAALPAPAEAGEEKPTEEMLDSVRGLLNWYGGGADKNAKSLRFHLKYDAGVVVPPDFEELQDTQHVNKAMFADILWRTMSAAGASHEQ